MDVLPSLQTLSSVAIWSNWRRILAYFPPAERYLEDLNADTLIHHVFGTRIGLGVLLFLSLAALTHFAFAGWRWARHKLLLYCYTKISIEQSSLLYRQVVDWTARHPHMFTSVNTGRIQIRYSEVQIDVPDEAGEIDITRMMNEIPPEFEPEIDQVKFWSNGSFFWMQERKEKKLQWHGKEAPDNWLDIYCLNWRRSTEPLKQLLTEILKNDAAQHCTKTLIYAPQTIWHLSGSSHTHAKCYWGRLRSRLRRPLSTVILDQRQKETIISDVRSFLSVSGVRWYEEKGLPLRLGYLFSGPPGTGKSSLAFAIASAFGLPVYMMNLSSPGLSDADVESLFSRLPRFCIVLLEDVDATRPLKRQLDGHKKKSEKDSDSDEQSDTSDSDSDDAMSGTGKKKGKGGADNTNTVTLSGLLNAIDGVAASEGRILIMTTNHIENLDEALIRTGRADRIVTFNNTTKQQAADMFINAYSGTRWTGGKRYRRRIQDSKTPSSQTGQSTSPETALASSQKQPQQTHKDTVPDKKNATQEIDKKQKEKEDDDDDVDNDVEDWTDEDIALLAKQFSDKIRDTEFSPALLQQYFKDFRAEPRRAVKELGAWMEDPRGYRKPGIGYESVIGSKKVVQNPGKDEAAKKAKKIEKDKKTNKKNKKEKKKKEEREEEDEDEQREGEDETSGSADGKGDADDDDAVKTPEKPTEKRTKRVKKLKTKATPELSTSPAITPPTTP
ncbi:hypothetical protein BD289DRAFT_453816 [Coniella lustricola]|uniref:AAA+ ATPase domain-containing protein n=1 Tax=Coniella lustricola TaxID=2025994 RepID=A0A2T3A613_9PEZI|nr:hypothetical protein BD289DRAFT_453816 [Coniella lustricola]